MVKSMELEFTIMVMEMYIMVNGLMILNMGRELLFIIYKMNNMKESGNLVRDMGKVHINMLWVIDMKDNGKEE